MFCEDCNKLSVILLDDARDNGIDPYWVEIECLDCDSRWIQDWVRGGENKNYQTEEV